jgi:hypothetical protein
MAQSSAAARSITKEQYEEGIRALRTSVKSDALKYKWLHLVDWNLAESSWNLFNVLKESGGFDKDGLRLWAKHFINNEIGFQLQTSEFLLFVLLISFTKVETKRGRRKDTSKKTQDAIVKRTSTDFFFSASEEDKRLVRVLWNLRKYFHVEIADLEARGLTTIHHPLLHSVSNWNDDEQVSRFINSIRPAGKSGVGESPKKQGKVGRKPKTQAAKGKNVIKSEPSWNSDSDQESSYFSLEESSSTQEIAAGNASYTTQLQDAMAVESYERQANYSNNESVQAFVQEFMFAPPRTYGYEEVVQYCMTRINHMFSFNEPERIQGFIDHLDGFFNGTSAPIYPGTENFVY